MNRDTLIGYITLAVIAGLLCIAMGYLLYASVFAYRKSVYVAFDRVGTLRVAAPVRLQGVRVGTVRAMAWKDKKAVVTIAFDRDVALRHGCRIISMPQGIMGGRFVSILNSDARAAPLPLRSQDTLQGIYYPGIPAMLSHITSLKTQFVRYNRVLAAVQGMGTDSAAGAATFVQRFDSLVYAVDSSVAALDTALAAWQTGPGRTMDSLVHVAKRAAAAGALVRQETPGLVDSLHRFSQLLLPYIVRIDTVVDRSAAVVSNLHALQYDSTLNHRVAGLQRRISRLRTTLETIHETDPALPTRPKW
jgi:phospholipid/cholesterol/gamma-HCH transport system substrate-binding protein